MTKSTIIKNLKTNRKQIDEIINEFESTNGDRVKIVFTLFKLMDTIGKTEADIYNYLRSLQ